MMSVCSETVFSHVFPHFLLLTLQHIRDRLEEKGELLSELSNVYKKANFVDLFHVGMSIIDTFMYLFCKAKVE